MGVPVRQGPLVHNQGNGEEGMKVAGAVPHHVGQVLGNAGAVNGVGSQPAHSPMRIHPGAPYTLSGLDRHGMDGPAGLELEVGYQGPDVLIRVALGCIQAAGEGLNGRFRGVRRLGTTL